MPRLPHIYHYARRVSFTLANAEVRKPMIVKEELLFQMAKKKAIEEEQDALMREMMRRIEYLPAPKAKVEETYEYYLFDSVDFPQVEHTRRVMYG